VAATPWTHATVLTQLKSALGANVVLDPDKATAIDAAIDHGFQVAEIYTNVETRADTWFNEVAGHMAMFWGAVAADPTKAGVFGQMLDTVLELLVRDPRGHKDGAGATPWT
jgi:hypothetical protein